MKTNEWLSSSGGQCDDLAIIMYLISCLSVLFIIKFTWF